MFAVLYRFLLPSLSRSRSRSKKLNKWHHLADFAHYQGVLLLAAHTRALALTQALQSNDFCKLVLGVAKKKNCAIISKEDESLTLPTGALNDSNGEKKVHFTSRKSRNKVT